MKEGDRSADPLFLNSQEDIESGARVGADFRQGLEDLCVDRRKADAMVRRPGDDAKSLGVLSCVYFLRERGSKVAILGGGMREDMRREEDGKIVNQLNSSQIFTFPFLV